MELDLSFLGYRELDILADSLKQYAKNGSGFLTGCLSFGFNENSGNVYLFDDEGNVGMLNDDGELKQFFSCFGCGHEGFAEDFFHEAKTEECTEYIKQVQETVK